MTSSQTLHDKSHCFRCHRIDVAILTVAVKLLDWLLLTVLQCSCVHRHEHTLPLISAYLCFPLCRKCLNRWFSLRKTRRQASASPACDSVHRAFLYFLNANKSPRLYILAPAGLHTAFLPLCWAHPPLLSYFILNKPFTHCLSTKIVEFHFIVHIHLLLFFYWYIQSVYPICILTAQGAKPWQFFIFFWKDHREKLLQSDFFRK